MRPLSVACLFLATLLATAVTQAHDGARIAEISKAAIPALVMIETQPPEAREPAAKDTGDAAFDAVGDIMRDSRRRRNFQGAGFFIDGDGTLVSAAHMFLDGARVQVTLHDGRVLPADLVGVDERSDVAVLRVRSLAVSPGALVLSEREPTLGEPVLAYGNPFGIGISLSTGVISAPFRSLSDSDGGAAGGMVQYDAMIGPGHAGGPLLDMQGEVVAMHTHVFSRAGNWDGLSFGVRASMLRHITGQLLAHGKVERGYLGILMQDVTPEIADAFGLPAPTGALVARATDGSPADVAGLLPGDIILQLNGSTVRSSADLAARFATSGPGSLVALKINRQGTEQIVTVTLTRMPERE